MIFCILKNEFEDSYLNWIKACQEFGVDHIVVDLVSSDWLSEIKKHPFDCFLACPSGREQHYKQMYDERIYIIERVLGKFVYPNYAEISLHENKRFLSYWLQANEIPHPLTYVFYNPNEADAFIKKTSFPIVGKMNIGASGKGVTIFRHYFEIKDYNQKAFSEGIRQAWGPNLRMGSYWHRLINLIKNPERIIKRLQVYNKLYNEKQKGFIILQEYVPHSFEWRVVRIGDSYFAHKKVKHGDKASGTKGILYNLPSDDLLNFVRNTCEKFGFNCMAIDLFEKAPGVYLVNEMQCIFGHVQDYICKKKGEPGRLRYIDNRWIFQPGSFNQNLSYNLRLENALTFLK